MESKLRAVLKELESSKLLCDQLLQERDDSEVEVKNIITKNTKLKNELAELHCTETHEHALTRISQLEHDLREAHNTINKLEASKQLVQSSDTLCLYDELVGGPSVRRVAFRARLKEPLDHHRWGPKGLMFSRGCGVSAMRHRDLGTEQEKEQGGF
ncbi:unnamed protein product [Spodoptera exigua]|nr:unnamed protein product [Spodoptera exigua]